MGRLLRWIREEWRWWSLRRLDRRMERDFRRLKRLARRCGWREDD